MNSYSMYIDGKWCGAESGETYDGINPALGEPFGKIACGGRADAQRAVAAANKALPSWREVPLWERSALCVKIANILDQQKEALAEIL